MADPDIDISEWHERKRRLQHEITLVREKVVKAALYVASDNFDQKAEDPGWTAELHDEMLTEAIKEYGAALNNLDELQRQAAEGRVG